MHRETITDPAKVQEIEAALRDKRTPSVLADVVTGEHPEFGFVVLVKTGEGTVLLKDGNGSGSPSPFSERLPDDQVLCDSRRRHMPSARSGYHKNVSTHYVSGRRHRATAAAPSRRCGGSGRGRQRERRNNQCLGSEEIHCYGERWRSQPAREQT